MPRSSSIAVRILSVLLGSILFFTNCLWAHKPETTIWEQRLLPYGTIRKVSKSQISNSKFETIIHIQDIHRNPEAQANISAAIKKLIETERVDTIALEGASEPIDLKPFQTFAHQPTIRTVADHMLKENRISGPIHAVLSEGRGTVIGIDDSLHYAANVDAYRASAPLMKPAQKKIAQRARALNEQKNKIFNPQLLAFDQRVAAYRAGESSLAEYARVLSTVDSPLPANFASFLEAVRIESSLNFSDLERQRAQMLETLLSKLNKEEAHRLMQSVNAYRNGEMSHTDFYGTLTTACESNGVSLARYPLMKTYFRYVQLSAGIDAEKLFDETRTLEQAAYRSLTQTSQERELIAESRRLYLAGKLAAFALTREEWGEYKTDENRKSRIDQGVINFENFYREAEVRDEKMAAKLLLFAPRTSNVVLLVTGGFHSSGIDDRLVKAGYTVVSFVPKITKVNTENGSAYLSVFTREKSPLEKLFEGEKLFLATHPFSKSEQEAFGLNSVTAALTGEFLSAGYLSHWLETAFHWTNVGLSVTGGAVNVTGFFATAAAGFSPFALTVHADGTMKISTVLPLFAEAEWVWMLLLNPLAWIALLGIGFVALVVAYNLYRIALYRYDSVHLRTQSVRILLPKIADLYPELAEKTIAEAFHRAYLVHDQKLLNKLKNEIRAAIDQTVKGIYQYQREQGVPLPSDEYGDFKVYVFYLLTSQWPNNFQGKYKVDLIVYNALYSAFFEFPFFLLISPYVIVKSVLRWANKNLPLGLKFIPKLDVSNVQARIRRVADSPVVFVHTLIVRLVTRIAAVSIIYLPLRWAFLGWKEILPTRKNPGIPLSEGKFSLLKESWNHFDPLYELRYVDRSWKRGVYRLALVYGGAFLLAVPASYRLIGDWGWFAAFSKIFVFWLGGLIGGALFRQVDNHHRVASTTSANAFLFYALLAAGASPETAVTWGKIGVPFEWMMGSGLSLFFVWYFRDNTAAEWTLLFSAKVVFSLIAAMYVFAVIHTMARQFHALLNFNEDPLPDSDVPLSWFGTTNGHALDFWPYVAVGMSFSLTPLLIPIALFLSFVSLTYAYYRHKALDDEAFAHYLKSVNDRRTSGGTATPHQNADDSVGAVNQSVVDVAIGLLMDIFGLPFIEWLFRRLKKFEIPDPYDKGRILRESRIQHFDPFFPLMHDKWGWQQYAFGMPLIWGSGWIGYQIGSAVISNLSFTGIMGVIVLMLGVASVSAHLLEEKNPGNLFLYNLVAIGLFIAMVLAYYVNGQMDLVFISRALAMYLFVWQVSYVGHHIYDRLAVHYDWPRLRLTTKRSVIEGYGISDVDRYEETNLYRDSDNDDDVAENYDPEEIIGPLEVNITQQLRFLYDDLWNTPDSPEEKEKNDAKYKEEGMKLFRYDMPPIRRKEIDALVQELLAGQAVAKDPKRPFRFLTKGEDLLMGRATRSQRWREGRGQYNLTGNQRKFLFHVWFLFNLPLVYKKLQVLRRAEMREEAFARIWLNYVEKAGYRYNYKEGKRFNTYGGWWILNGIGDAIDFYSWENNLVPLSGEFEHLVDNKTENETPVTFSDKNTERVTRLLLRLKKEQRDILRWHYGIGLNGGGYTFPKISVILNLPVHQARRRVEQAKAEMDAESSLLIHFNPDVVHAFDSLDRRLFELAYQTPGILTDAEIASIMTHEGYRTVTGHQYSHTKIGEMRRQIRARALENKTGWNDLEEKTGIDQRMLKERFVKWLSRLEQEILSRKFGLERPKQDSNEQIVNTLTLMGWTTEKTKRPLTTNYIIDQATLAFKRLKKEMPPYQLPGKSSTGKVAMSLGAGLLFLLADASGEMLISPASVFLFGLTLAMIMIKWVRAPQLALPDMDFGLDKFGLPMRSGSKNKPISRAKSVLDRLAPPVDRPFSGKKRVLTRFVDRQA